MTPDEIRLMLMTAVVTIGLLSIIIGIRNRIIDNRKMLKVEINNKIILAQESMISDVKFQHMVLSIDILNVGKVPIFIYQPCIKLPKKIDGFDLFQVVNPNETTKFPLKLEQGQTYNKELSLRQFFYEFKGKVKPNKKVHFQITDTMGKVFKSKRRTFAELVKHIETEDMLNARK